MNVSATAISALVVALTLCGCVPQSKVERQSNLVWGRRGLSENHFSTPRAVEISPDDQLFIVDKTGRIQVFDTEGTYLRSWRTPEIFQGKPTGLGWSNDGHLMVADTHYYRVLFYTPEGTLDESRTIGGENGDEPGQFHFVTDVAQDARGHYFVGQYGQIDRIQEFDPHGMFIRRWGSQGSKPGEFSRPQALAFDELGRLWIADACNHRIQIYDVAGPEPQLVEYWGTPGPELGQLLYPYGLVFDRDGSVLITEYGNHRVQRFTRTGESIEAWGHPGTQPGQLLSPWSLILDSKRQLFVLDSQNHRVQRFDLR